MSSQKLKNQTDSLKAKEMQLKLYEQAVQNSPDLFSIVDKDYVYRAVNPTYVKRYRKPEKEVVGRHAAEIVGQEVFEKILKPHLDKSLAGETVHYQTWITYSGLGMRYMDVSYSPLPDEHGSVEHVAAIIRDITEQESAERALKESEQRYRTLIEEAKDIIYSLDPNTGIINSFNGFAEETLGYRREDVWGKMHFIDLIHPDDHERVVKQYKRVFMGGERQPNYPFRLRKGDGTYIDVEQNATILRDANGEPYDCIGVIRDVTERKRMEEAVRLSEQRHHQILDTTLDYVVIMNANAEVLYANKAWHDNVTYTLEELSGPQVFETIHPDDRKEVRRQFQKALAGASVRNLQYRSIRKNGETRWLEANANPIHWPGAETAVLAVVRDITQRKQMEETIRISEERYHRILESSHDMISVIDENAGILFGNESWVENSLYTLDEANERGVLNTIHPDDRERIGSWFQRVMGGHPARCVEYRVVGKHGEIEWREANADPIKWPGAERALLNVARDITDRKRMEEDLRLSEERYHRILASSHDMVVVADQSSRVLFANKSYQTGTGYTIDETNEFGVFRLVHPEDRGEALRVFQAALNGKPARNFECRRINKDGGVRWVESNVDPIHWHGAEKALLVVSRDVTDRKRMEKALRESEERYRNMFCEAPDIFYVLDLDTWVISDANKYALKVLEYGPEDLGRVHVSEIIHPDDYERSANRLRDMVMKKDRHPNFPLRVLTRTGKVRHIEQSGVLFWDENGRARSFLGLAHDVTHLKKQEEMIRRRNEKLAALYEVARAVNESLSLGSVIDLTMEAVPSVTNSDAVSIYLYDEKTQTLNYSAYRGFSEDLIQGTDGMKLGEGIHGHVAQTRQPLILQDVLNHPLLGRRTYTKKAEYESAMVVPLVVMDKLYGILTVARKPGKHYGAEDLDLLTALANIVAVAMHKADLYSRVLQREKHLESILETAQDGIAVFSDYHPVYYNSAGNSIFGYSENDDVHSLGSTDFLAPESHSLFSWIIQKLEKREPIDWTLEVKGIRKDGTTFDAEIKIGFFFEGDKRHVVTATRDVTDRKRLEFQLHQSSKLAAIGELAAGVAHEINNPVANIDVQTGLMREILADERENLGDALFDRLDKYLSITEDQVQKCRSVTNHLLSFSRTPTSREETFEINKLLKRTVELVVRLTDEKPEVEMSLDERRPLFRGDPNRLEQVFVNLLNNALKATGSDGSIVVTTRLDDDGNIRVEFRDSGHGIPDEIKDRIFDPFFTTRSEGEGTGLGLSICFYLIKEMNGKLDVESSSGQGATFTITLPGDAGTLERGHVC